MYPLIRLPYHILRYRNAAPLPLTGTHESTLICWPWDIDPWMELNNGRTLTLYDLGRVAMGIRIGLAGVLRENRWGITVAGNSVRYRVRVRAFDRLVMRSRVSCWDARFVYIEQSMWNRAGQCTSHQLVRGAMTDANGIVPVADVAKALGHDGPSPEMPEWIARWVHAEEARPWPPMSEDSAEAP